jgi:hypothetical protein
MTGSFLHPEMVAGSLQHPERASCKGFGTKRAESVAGRGFEGDGPEKIVGRAFRGPKGQKGVCILHFNGTAFRGFTGKRSLHLEKFFGEM